MFNPIMAPTTQLTRAQVRPGQPLDVPPLIPPGTIPPADAPAVVPMLVYVKEKNAWEYKLITRNLGKEEALDEEELNRWGADGWELTGIAGDSPIIYFYFKRMRR